MSDQSCLTAITTLTREQRWRVLRQRPAIVWLTGLSGSGKSSIAAVVDRTLMRAGRHSMVLDGDNIRRGLNSDLGFSVADRIENIRRVAETARLIAESGQIVIVSLISPFRDERAAARHIAGDIPFLEIFINTPLNICETRDPKGLYRLARAGKIPDFTGVSSPYEAPTAPDFVIGTCGVSIEASANLFLPTLIRLTAF